MIYCSITLKDSTASLYCGFVFVLYRELATPRRNFIGQRLHFKTYFHVESINFVLDVSQRYFGKNKNVPKMTDAGHELKFMYTVKKQLVGITYFFCYLYANFKFLHIFFTHLL